MSAVVPCNLHASVHVAVSSITQSFRLAGVGRFFFFSSRRRHTRLVSDWSSDVCSSDLSTRASFVAPPDTILTNAHVVSSDRSVTLRRPGGATKLARVETAATELDLAVLRIDRKSVV